MRAKHCPNGAITLTMSEEEAKVLLSLSGAVVGGTPATGRNVATPGTVRIRQITDARYHALSTVVNRPGSLFDCATIRTRS